MADFFTIRADFLILKQKINGKRLVYLDSAATSQKPKQVIEAEKVFYETINANVARSIHYLSEKATEAYENSRKKVADFINSDSDEIIFVRNTTEAINLAANGLDFKKDDEIITTLMEHHSNIVPWQIICKKTGAKLKIVDTLPDGQLDLKQFEKFLSSKTKLVAVTHVSNVLGTINPVKEITRLAKKFGALVLIDGAQGAPHMKVDVNDIGCDFYAFSGHKLLAPTGIGVLFGKKEILDKMQPFLYGGHMIKKVTKESSTFMDAPERFEAGTANFAGAVALGAAIDYLEKIGMENVREHEKELTRYALEKLSKIKDIEIYGPKNAEIRGGVISFNIKGAHPHDVAQILDSEGIAIRSGHACAMPLMQRLGAESICRASFYIYNDKKDVDALVKGLEKVKGVLKL
ncbi:MAG: cysteine desulfurase [DPANN group archaeon]|nr:cysteine desulfurase [DPANN group archaeon]